MKVTRCVSFAAVVLLLTLLTSSPALPFRGFDPPARPDYDMRLPNKDEDRSGFVLRDPTLAQRARADLLLAQLPGLTLRWDGMSGAPKWLAAPAGAALSLPAAGKPEDLARLFLASHVALYGLKPHEIDALALSSVVPAPDGGWHVHFTQSVEGIDVFGSHANVNLNPDGSVRSVGATLFAGIPRQGSPALAAVDAIRQVVAGLYPDLGFSGRAVEALDRRDRMTTFEQGSFGIPPQARLVLFPTATGARLAWEIRVGEKTLITSYVVLVDSLDGSVLYRRNTTLYAEARIVNADHPEIETDEQSSEQYQLVTIPANTPESPNGWIDGAGTTLQGNNAVSHLWYRTEPPLSEPTGIYDYVFNTNRSALVNAWWWVNDAHDRFYDLGFDEPAGNFQQDNFGLGGTGGDPVHVVFYPWTERNSAWISPQVPDGQSVGLNFTWLDCQFCGDRDGYPENGTEKTLALEQATIYHEYTHGVTLRMVGGPADMDCLGGYHSASLGEGWSDFFAASFTGDTSDGEYCLEGLGFNRDMRHDMDFTDFCDESEGSCDYYANGMIWAGTLWDLRESILALDPTTGLEKLHRILIESLASAPCSPTFLDARDALLDADKTLYPLPQNKSEHDVLIWNVFAARGMGKGASATGDSDYAPVADFTVDRKMECTAPSTPTGVSAAPEGDNAIRVSFNATGADAVEVWREDLDNSLDVPVYTGSTNSLSSWLDTDVHGGRSYRYHVVALGTGGEPCRSGVSGTADATATGACGAYPLFNPQLTIDDDNPDCSVTLSWDAASPGCPASPEPIVYNVYRAPTPGYSPAEKLLIGRTTSTSWQDMPPETPDDLPISFDTGGTHFYLVLAQHGTLDDPADHRRRGVAQIFDWEPGLPTAARTTVHAWTFDAGPEGWTTDTSSNPSGDWVLVEPSPTYYGGAMFAPDVAAGGSGMAWVTGDAGGPSHVADNDSDGEANLFSPVWDGTNGAMILSFDYWNYTKGGAFEGLEVWVDNGAVTELLVGPIIRTAQEFETSGVWGWQHAEFDLSRIIAPTATMTVRLSTGVYHQHLNELGVDNVRIERATSCARCSLRIDDVTIDDSPAGWGNGNGVLDPGETARLTVQLANDGSVTAFAPVGRLSTVVPGLTIHEDEASFPDLPPLASGASISPGFTVTAPSASDCDEMLAFEFEFVDASGIVSTDTWNVELGRVVTVTVFEDDFETDKGWTTNGHPAGSGEWERGDPEATWDGTSQANPEDCASGPGTLCYVTGLAGGDANANDADMVGTYPTSDTYPELYSPTFDLTGYKRARYIFDLWYYEAETTSSNDYGRYQLLHDGSAQHTIARSLTTTWRHIDRDFTYDVPMATGMSFRAVAFDNGTDNVVEMAIDNLIIEGDLQTCDALGVGFAPNGIGDTLRVAKSATTDITWTASPIDGSHDGAAYYELYVSTAPDAGFAVTDTTTTTGAPRPLDLVTEFYKLVAINAAGTSGDEPTP